MTISIIHNIIRVVLKGEIKIRDKKVKTISILIALGLLPAVWYLSDHIDDQKKYKSNTLYAIEDEMKYYDIGEHIISAPFSSEIDMRYNIVQHTYYPGYEPIGITMSEYGLHGKNYSGGAIVYVNVEELDGSSRSFFESQAYNQNGQHDKKGTAREFGIGEHILSVPINENISLDYYQYTYHEGYEVVGIATDDYAWEHSDNYDGGVILYKNITPVRCVCGDNGYTSFGSPIEKENTMKLTK